MRAADRIAARRAAREKQARAVERRRLKREAEQTALGAFEFALQHRDDAGMATAVIELVNLGNSVQDIGALTNQDAGEIRRLRKLASPQRAHLGVRGGTCHIHQLPR